MDSLSAWFKNQLIKNNNIKTLTVIGSGGKTSLIWHLAKSLAAPATVKPCYRILVTPTTKMCVPSPEEELYDHYYNGLPPNALGGITLSGIFNKRNEKLESLPIQELENLIPAYNFVLIEGDGSRWRPLKAWAEDEPVVPPFTDITIGVLPLWPVGKPVSEELIHRLSLFSKLTGAEEGEIIKLEHIIKIITGEASKSPGTEQAPLSGLFAKAQGKKILFFNQVEDEETLALARKLAGQLPPELCKVIAGSVKEDRVVEL